MSKNFNKSFIAPALLLILSSITITFSFFNIQVNHKIDEFNGTVGISTYFQCGNGSKGDPYVIARPRHLYNLSRLQELGAFSGEKNYFKIGLQQEDGNYVYKTDNSDELLNSQVLDMSNYVSDVNKIDFHPIGSHLTPFMSEIDGGDIIIDNLTVIGENDDVGVFGYCDNSSVISNLAFTNLEIHSKGYSTSFQTPYKTVFENSMTYNNTIPETLSEEGKIITDERTSYVEGNDLFKSVTVTLPADTTDVKFIAKAASPLLSKVNSTTFEFNRSLIDTKGNDGFLNNYDKETNILSNVINSQIYIIAQSEDIHGVIYSHVIDSYTISLYNNMTLNGENITNNLSLVMTKDNSNQSEFKISPSHKFNVGLIVGHLDGSLTRAQIYNGQIYVNEQSSKHVAIAQESDFGTIGQVGSNVSSNQLDPSSLAKEDTGYIFTDELVQLCRRDNFVLDNVSKSSVYYNPTSIFARDWNNSSSPYYTIFNAILKYIVTESDGTKHIYGASSIAGNNVLFKRNYLVKGGLNTPLGIFDIVTPSKNNSGGNADTPNTDYSSLLDKNSIPSTPTAGLAFGLISGSNPKNGKKRMLYIADEFKNDANLSYEVKLNDTSVARSFAGGTANDSYDDNYVNGHPKTIHMFEFDMDANADKLYFNNTSIPYLKESLDRTLVDSSGLQIPSTSQEYGISIKKYDYTSETQENISGFNENSIMNKVSGMRNGSLEVTNPIIGSTLDASGKFTNVVSSEKFTSGTLSFSLKRPGNVTICIPYRGSESFGTKDSTNTFKPYLTICKKYTDDTKKTITSSTNKPIVAMPYPSTYEQKSIDYIDTNGNLKKETSDSLGEGIVFVHTFKLDSGDYFISTNGDTKIYSTNIAIAYNYISVEGQEVGRLTGNATAFQSTSYSNVSFLLYDPIKNREVLFVDDKKLVICVFLLKFSEKQYSSTDGVSSMDFVGNDDGFLYLSFHKDGTLLEMSGQNPENEEKPLMINGKKNKEYNPTFKYST